MGERSLLSCALQEHRDRRPDARIDVYGVPLSLEPKRTLSAVGPEEMRSEGRITDFTQPNPIWFDPAWLVLAAGSEQAAEQFTLLAETGSPPRAACKSPFLIATRCRGCSAGPVLRGV